MVKKYFSTPKVIFYLIAFAALLRFWGIFNEFWMDEIWSFLLVSTLNSPVEVLTKLFVSNNHPLNSFFMYFIGQGDPTHWFKFRLLSLLAGILTIPVAYLITVKIFPSKAWRLITTALVAISFPLIFYSSEARGYALAAFFSLLSFYLLLKLFEKKNIGLLLAFYCSFVLGYLSSLIFVYISFGLLSTFIYFQFNQRKASRPGPKIFDLLEVFALPVILVFILYFKFVSNFSLGGADVVASLSEVLKEVAAYLVGFPQNNGYSYGIAVVVYILLFKEMFDLFREKSLFGIFCVSSTFGICLYLFFMRSSVLFFRYFICFYPFLIILLSHCLYRATVKFRVWRLPIAVIIVLIIGGNIVSYFNFIKFGRGHYQEALEHMYESDGKSPITVGSDQDFEIQMVLDFYGMVKPDIKIVYIPSDKVKVQPPEWFILHTVKRDFYSPHFLTPFQGPRYAFEGAYLYCGDFSGSNWLLYHVVVK